MSDLPRDHDVLLDLLRPAGRYAVEARGSAEAEWKADGSPVTAVDRHLDATLAAGLLERYPGAGVLGEEGAKTAGKGTFHIDPIDGTRAYLQGLAHWGPTVCFEEDGELLFGAFYMPLLDAFYYAERGRGAWRNGVPLPGPSTQHPRNDQILFAPSRIHDAPRGLWPGKVRVLGSAAAHMALVAAGAGAATLIPTWSLWDVGCGALLISESGGVLCGLDGTPIDVVRARQGLPFLAGAPTALQDVVTAWQNHQGVRTDGRT